MRDTILVTGGTGFLGSHLCERCVIIQNDTYFTPGQGKSLVAPLRGSQILPQTPQPNFRESRQYHRLGIVIGSVIYHDYFNVWIILLPYTLQAQ